MARKIFALILLFGLFLAVGSQAGDGLIRIENLIAVTDIQCGDGVNKKLAVPLTNVIIDEIVKVGAYTVIDRANRDKILSEQNFQQTCHVGECVVEMGQLLGVGKIIVGNIDRVGKTYLINIQLINVKTGAVENSVNEKCKCDEEGLIDTVRAAARKLMSPVSAPVQPVIIGAPAIQPPVVPFAGTGVITIVTNPIGADVFLDAQPVGKTPLTIPGAAVGVHQLTITRKGYATLSKNVEVHENMPTLVNEILSQQTGAIDLQSAPAGADCWVDGKYIGKTPQKIPAVIIGPHTVKITLPNYQDFSAEVNVDANATASISAPLAGLPGRILVTSAPDGAEVFIEGKKAGVTPYSGQLAPGSHQVRVSMNGFQSWEETVIIEPNKPKTLNLILKKGPDVRGDMVLVPAGEFTMGSKSGAADEKPVHRVYLDVFQIDKYEVTNEQYAACVQAGKCSDNKKFNGFTDPKQPVVGVEWNQASRYCSWAGKRLPTEAEWEKAARGKDGRTYPWGEGIDCGKANCGDCKYGKTKPVGSYLSGASPYGVMDIAGNVWEWCSDWYDKNYYKNSPNRNPTGSGSGQYRVLRGGSWDDHSSALRSSFRSWSNPDAGDYNVGFRCAKTP